MKDWWGYILFGMLRQSKNDLRQLDESLCSEDSWESLCVLMREADNLHFLQHAYDERGSGHVHVEVVFLSD